MPKPLQPRPQWPSATLIFRSRARRFGPTSLHPPGGKTLLFPMKLSYFAAWTKDWRGQWPSIAVVQGLRDSPRREENWFNLFFKGCFMLMNAKQVSCLWNKNWHESTPLYSGVSFDGAGGVRTPKGRSLWYCWALWGLWMADGQSDIISALTAITTSLSPGIFKSFFQDESSHVKSNHCAIRHHFNPLTLHYGLSMLLNYPGWLWRVA